MFPLKDQKSSSILNAIVKFMRFRVLIIHNRPRNMVLLRWACGGLEIISSENFDFDKIWTTKFYNRKILS